MVVLTTTDVTAGVVVDVVVVVSLHSVHGSLEQSDGTVFKLDVIASCVVASGL